MFGLNFSLLLFPFRPQFLSCLGLRVGLFETLTLRLSLQRVCLVAADVDLLAGYSSTWLYEMIKLGHPPGCEPCECLIATGFFC